MFQYSGISIIISIHLYITCGCFWTNIVKLNIVRDCVVHRGKHIYSQSSIGKVCPPNELLYFLKILYNFLNSLSICSYYKILSIFTTLDNISL